MKPIYTFLLTTFFFLIFTMHFTSSTDLNQDLGRHIKLGETIIKAHTVPSTNLFSYTNQNFPFTNHHWLSEVFFYLISISSGISSLIFIKVIVLFMAFGILIHLGFRTNHPITTMFTAFLFSPLLLERSTIRPELFGYALFCGLLYILFSYPSSKRLLFFVPFIMVLWINLHISFIFGFVVVGFLCLKILWRFYREKKKYILNDLYILAGSVVLTVLNPHGIFGLLYPFNIFTNYGYTIVENQNVIFLNSITMNPHIKYLFFFSPVVCFSIGWLFYKKKVLESTLFVIFFIATTLQIRHMPFFAFVAIPTVSMVFNDIKNKLSLKKNHTVLAATFLSVMCFGISILFMQNVYSNTFDQQKSFGMNVVEDGNRAAEFVLANHLPAQMFNNFDIGGYAIYKLYPQYEVFVDNRPEAYPRDFLQNVYIGLQNDPSLRKKIFHQYNIKTIFFSHTDQTPWANAFLNDIVSDSQWKLVYLDSSMIVMTSETNLPDIRNDHNYLTQLITKETDYINLLKLTRIFGFLKDEDELREAFLKAQEINPHSCAITRGLYSQYVSIQSSKVEEIKSTSPYCF